MLATTMIRYLSFISKLDFSIKVADKIIQACR
jgi:hypothetical protein